MDRSGTYDDSLNAGQNFNAKAIRIGIETTEAIDNASFAVDLQCASLCEFQATIEANGLLGLTTEFSSVSTGPGIQTVTLFSGVDLIAASWAFVVTPLGATNFSWISSDNISSTWDGRASHTGTSITDSVNPNVATGSIFTDVTGFNLNYTLTGDPADIPDSTAVPLPAGGVLLLTALGALALRRTRSE